MGPSRSTGTLSGFAPRTVKGGNVNKTAARSSSSSATLTLNAVAEELGVHYMTAYRYVRTGRLAATKVGGGWVVQREDLDAFRSGPAPRTRGARVDWCARLGDRLIDGDETGAWTVIEDSMASGLEPRDVYLEVLSPALAAIGAGWAAGEVTIAEEHRATAVTNRLIGRLGPRFNRPGRTRGTVVVGAVAGDQHAVPIAMAADLLRERGFTVVDLGADSPIESFLDAARRADRLIAVGVSSTAADIDDQVIATVDALREEIGCPVVIGGQGLGARARRAEVAAVSGSADEMLDAFDRIASVESSN